MTIATSRRKFLTGAAALAATQLLAPFLAPLLTKAATTPYLAGAIIRTTINAYPVIGELGLLTAGDLVAGETYLVAFTGSEWKLVPGAEA